MREEEAKPKGREDFKRESQALPIYNPICGGFGWHEREGGRDRGEREPS